MLGIVDEETKVEEEVVEVAMGVALSSFAVASARTTVFTSVNNVEAPRMSSGCESETTWVLSS
jgi:hypothetical protein